MEEFKIVLIGAGNLATQLAVACSKEKLDINQIYSRTKDSAKTLADLCNSEYTTDLVSIKKDADLYIYAVTDNALSEIIPLINTKHGLHVHTAGSIPITIFKDFQENYGSFYPFQTFSKQRSVDFRKIPILIEANNETNALFLENLGKKLSHQVIRCSSDQRKAVHLSGVFACNFTNHMYSIAEGILKKANVPFEILQALIDETATKTQQLSPKDAQTGPAVRYDTSIIDKHIEALKDMPAEQELYKAISKNIHEYGKF